MHIKINLVFELLKQAIMRLLEGFPVFSMYSVIFLGGRGPSPPQTRGITCNYGLKTEIRKQKLVSS